MIRGNNYLSFISGNLRIRYVNQLAQLINCRAMIWAQFCLSTLSCSFSRDSASFSWNSSPEGHWCLFVNIKFDGWILKSTSDLCHSLLLVLYFIRNFFAGFLHIIPSDSSFTSLINLLTPLMNLFFRVQSGPFSHLVKCPLGDCTPMTSVVC